MANEDARCHVKHRGDVVADVERFIRAVLNKTFSAGSVDCERATNFLPIEHGVTGDMHTRLGNLYRSIKRRSCSCKPTMRSANHWFRFQIRITCCHKHQNEHVGTVYKWSHHVRICKCHGNDASSSIGRGEVKISRIRKWRPSSNSQFVVSKDANRCRMNTCNA